MKEILNISVTDIGDGFYTINIKADNDITVTHGPYLSTEELIHDVRVYAALTIRHVLRNNNES